MLCRDYSNAMQGLQLCYVEITVMLCRDYSNAM